MMKIEIVDFFPKPVAASSKIFGQLHVYICDFDMDIRGFVVSGSRKSLWVGKPAAWGFDHETGKSVMYPVVSFTDEAKNKDLLAAIKAPLKSFLDQWFADHPEASDVAEARGFAVKKS